MPQKMVEESKADKFNRLATARMQAAVGKIRQMHNLASSNYEYTDEQVDKLEAIFEKEVKSLMEKLRGESVKDALPEL